MSRFNSLPKKVHRKDYKQRYPSVRMEPQRKCMKIKKIKREYPTPFKPHCHT